MGGINNFAYIYSGGGGVLPAVDHSTNGDCQEILDTIHSNGFIY